MIKNRFSFNSGDSRGDSKILAGDPLRRGEFALIKRVMPNYAFNYAFGCSV